MKTNKILIAALIGGAVAFVGGFLLYGVVLADFFQKNTGSATGVMRGDNEMLWIPMILGHLALGALLAIIFGRWANISTFITGVKAGAVIGFLITAAHDLISLGSTHISNTNATLVDILTATFLSAIVGGVVAWFLGRNT